MGVVFMVCNACKQTFPDCGSYAHCNEDLGGCGRSYCSDKCAKLTSPGRDEAVTWQEADELYKTDREAWEALKTGCVDCRGELPNDRNVLAFLLTRAGLTRSEADAEYLASRAPEAPSPLAGGAGKDGG